VGLVPPGDKQALWAAALASRVPWGLFVEERGPLCCRLSVSRFERAGGAGRLGLAAPGSVSPATSTCPSWGASTFNGASLRTPYAGGGRAPDLTVEWCWPNLANTWISQVFDWSNTWISGLLALNAPRRAPARCGLWAPYVARARGAVGRWSGVRCSW
jgi:hypothetical protein